jgi:uncharacterized protein with ParB-like and HNH nuclease domain
VKADDSTVRDIFAGEIRHIIPVFQRRYAWEQERWEALWNDLLAVVEDNSRDGISHFIGPLVMAQNIEPGQVISSTIIDGQQRLVTLTLIFCVLRDIAQKLGFEEFGKSVTANVLIFRDTRGASYPKVVPKIEDREFFNKIVEGRYRHQRGKSESLISDAYSFFTESISSYLDENIPGSSESEQRLELVIDKLEQIYIATTQRLRLIRVELDERDNPSNIFESLNFKQAKLSPSDLIRNFIFMQLPVRLHDSFNDTYWSKIEQVFGSYSNGNNEKYSEEITDFYYRYLVLKTEYFPKNSLYPRFIKYIKKNVQNHDHSENFIRDLSVNLTDCARTYKKIIENRFSSEPEVIRNIFFRFEYLGVETAIPVYLELYERYQKDSRDHTASLREFEKYAKVIESWVLRRSFFRKSSRLYGKDFAESLKYIGDYDEFVRYFIDKDWPDDIAVTKQLCEFPIYLHERKKTKLVLFEIERRLSQNKEVVDPESLEIEHILPQRIEKSTWVQYLGKGYKNIHYRYLHTLGNLTLTGYNKDLSREPFSRKQEIFKSGRVELNRYFEELENWKGEEIHQRSEELAKYVTEIWPRPSCKQVGETDFRGSGQLSIFDIVTSDWT